MALLSSETNATCYHLSGKLTLQRRKQVKTFVTKWTVELPLYIFMATLQSWSISYKKDPSIVHRNTSENIWNRNLNCLVKLKWIRCYAWAAYKIYFLFFVCFSFVLSFKLDLSMRTDNLQDILEFFQKEELLNVTDCVHNFISFLFVCYLNP